MIKQLAVITLACAGLAFVSPGYTETEVDCGPNYPLGLPCIEGGKLVHDEAPVFPGMPHTMVLAYWSELIHVRQGMELAAQHSDWTIEQWDVGEEPDGPRYRTRLVRGENVVMVSLLREQE